MKWQSLATLALILSSTTSRGPAETPERPAPPTELAIFESGEGGYHSYRIPALAVTPRGAILAICEGRKTGRGDHGDVDLVFRRSEDGGKSWSPLSLLHEEGGDAKITIGNPCIVVDEAEGVVWLLLTRDNDRVLATSSRDEGRTWSRPRDITAEVKGGDWTWYATGPGNGIQLKVGPRKGRLVIPCDHRVRGIDDRAQASRSHVVYSDDHGRTWHAGGATEVRMNECAVVELTDGRLLLNMRSFRGKARRGVATSDDGGATWSPVVDDPTLVEPVCQASLIRYSWEDPGEKGRLLFANPAHPKRRENLTVRLSDDEGRTWPVKKTIWGGSAIYSSLARLPDGAIGLLYEREDYKRIVFTRLCLAWLTEGAIRDDNTPRH